MNHTKLLQISDIEFESKGVDVQYIISYGYNDLPISDGDFYRAHELFRSFWENTSCNQDLRIELKPDIGDDFPAVLRQMKASRSNVLLIRNYTGKAATFDQLRNFFISQKIQVFKEKEIDRTSLPAYDRELEFPSDFLLQLLEQ